MYFLQHIKTQFTAQLASYGGPEWPSEAEKTPAVEWPKWPDDIIADMRQTGEDAHRTAESMRTEKLPKLEAWAQALEWGTEVSAEWTPEAGETEREGELNHDEIDTLAKNTEKTSQENTEKSQQDIDALKNSEDPEKQREWMYLQALHDTTRDLNPTDAEKVRQAFEEFQNSEEYAQLSPEEIEQQLQQISEAFSAQWVQDIQSNIDANAWRVEEAQRALSGDIKITPLQRAMFDVILWRNRANTYNQSVLRWEWGGSWSWQNFPEWERPQSGRYRSEPAERSSTWVTLCSKTARLNLEKMGVENPLRWSSARESYNMYGRQWDTWFPQWSSDKRVADVYIDASPRNAQYGHRVAAFQDNGQWYILDPYYRIPWHESDRQAPIPAESYLNHMCGTKGRKFWGAQYPETA